MSNESPAAQRSVFEKHAQTVIQLIIGGLCFWMATTTNDTSRELAVLTERITTMKVQLETLQSSSTDRYFPVDADKAHKPMLEDIAELKSRVRSLEFGK
jgi:hypothetical protein